MFPSHANQGMQPWVSGTQPTCISTPSPPIHSVSQENTTHFRYQRSEHYPQYLASENFTVVNNFTNQMNEERQNAVPIDYHTALPTSGPTVEILPHANASKLPYSLSAVFPMSQRVNQRTSSTQVPVPPSDQALDDFLLQCRHRST